MIIGIWFFRSASGKRNFGDEISLFLLRKILTNKAAILDARKKALASMIRNNLLRPLSLLSYLAFKLKMTTNEYYDLLAAGSILDEKSKRADIIWGSGFIDSKSRAELKESVRIVALRGKLSHEIMTRENATESISYGDPGLLISKFIEKQNARDKICIVPHYQHYSLFQNRKWSDPEKDKMMVLNVRSSFRKIARHISASSLVLSSSLHGIIFAHAYGIPAIRLVITDVPMKGADFKFNDYYSAFGDYEIRVPELRLRSDEIGGWEESMQEILDSDGLYPIAPASEEIERIQEELIKSIKQLVH